MEKEITHGMYYEMKNEEANGHQLTEKEMKCIMTNIIGAGTIFSTIDKVIFTIVTIAKVLGLHVIQDSNPHYSLIYLLP